MNQSEYSAAAIGAFEKAVEEHLAGRVPAENFRAARVEMGVYAQRQKDFYMLRTRLPGGRVTQEALEKYAELADTLPTGSVHLTTRQDIQLHFVRIEQAPGLMRKLAQAGVSSAGAGGNTIRNITACVHPGAGRNSRSAAIAMALNAHFTGHEFSRGLPRKFKISICSWPGCYSGLTDDLAFVPAREPGGEGLFDVYAGGGQGSAPRLGQLLERGYPAENINRIVLAALKVFNRHGTRKNRSRARLKFLIERIGFGEFERMYREEIALLGELAPLDIVAHQEDESVPSGAREMLIRVAGGDLTSLQLRGLAGVLAETGASAQVVKNADLLFSGVETAEWGGIAGAINKLGLLAGEYREGHTIATCNGSITCSEGITNSRGLSHRLGRILHFAGGPAVSLRVSGCPNACSGHHTADIGLQGSARRVNGALIPHYVVSVGGATDGAARLAKPIGRIPAKNAPAAVESLLRLIASAANANETAAGAIARLGEDLLEAELKPFEAIGDDMAQHRKDYDTEGDFNVDEVGPGECAGSALDIIDGYFDQARRDIHSAEKAPDHAASAAMAHRAAILSARALLVKYGVDPASDILTVETFKSTVIAGDENPSAWNMAILALSLPTGALSAPDSRLRATREFFDKCHEAYTLGSLPLAASGKAPAGKVVRMDLSGVACPFNYTKIKLRLETLPVGARIEALVDDGAPIRNVPRSLENDGQKVISISPSGSRHLILLEKAC